MDNTPLLNRTTVDQTARERISQSLRDMVDEAEQLLKNVQRTGHDQLGTARDKLQAKLHSVAEEAARLEDNALQQVRRSAQAADHAVHEHPYASMGLAAGVGVLLGLLIARR